MQHNESTSAYAKNMIMSSEIVSSILADSMKDGLEIFKRNEQQDTPPATKILSYGLQPSPIQVEKCNEVLNQVFVHTFDSCKVDNISETADYTLVFF